MSKIITLAPKRPARMSQKVRVAIHLMVTEGRNITQAAEGAGMSRAGLHKALKRPEVQDFLEDQRRKFISDMEGKRALYKAQALEVALDLMLNSKNESVRARMVEFLASDAKVSPVAVHIDARQAPAYGYEYRRPGAIEATDTDSQDG